MVEKVRKTLKISTQITPNGTGHEWVAPFGTTRCGDWMGLVAKQLELDEARVQPHLNLDVDFSICKSLACNAPKLHAQVMCHLLC